MWLSSDEALLRLGVKPQSLYASVSRGRIRARTDPVDPRKSLYNQEDVDRAARRSAGRRAAATVAAETIRWGEPVLDSAITTIQDGRLFYRGRNAVTLAETATLEDVAQLLWEAPEPVALDTSETSPPEPIVSLAGLVADALPSTGRMPAALRTDARLVATYVAAAICGPRSGPVHIRLAAILHRPEAADPLRRALVLLADHELNASTFAARVTVSTGASLAAGALAGLCALGGPLHGTAALAVLTLARRAAEIGVGPAVRERLAEGRGLPAIGHPLYPKGDPRAAALLAEFEAPPLYADLGSALADATGESPNVDFALAALAAAYALPDTAPARIFALARTVGWLAHMLEQAASGTLIRPRARYNGVLPVT